MATDNRDDQKTPDGAEKDPDEWVTGDESMTGPQASYLKTLAHEAGEEVDETRKPKPRSASTSSRSAPAAAATTDAPVA